MIAAKSSRDLAQEIRKYGVLPTEEWLVTLVETFAREREQEVLKRAADVAENMWGASCDYDAMTCIHDCKSPVASAIRGLATFLEYQ